MSWLYLLDRVRFFSTHCTRSSRVPPAPGLPCALCSEGATNLQSSGENRVVRMRACVYRRQRLSIPVIASEAKQSSFLRRGNKAGLLRRYAPRNDDEPTSPARDRRSRKSCSRRKVPSSW